jgi:hypothetical protein
VIVTENATGSVTENVTGNAIEKGIENVIGIATAISMIVPLKEKNMIVLDWEDLEMTDLTTHMVAATLRHSLNFLLGF